MTAPEQPLSSDLDHTPFGRGHRIRKPTDFFTPAAYSASVLSEPLSYRDTILHQEWQHAVAEDIVALECTGT